MHGIWTTRSFRFWIALGMATAVLPLLVSALGGYLIVHRGAVASLQDIAARQRHQIDPTQHLRLLLWDSVVPVDEFIDEGNRRQSPAYRLLRERIEAAFNEVHAGLRSNPEARAKTERAREDWTQADRLATEAFAVHRPPGDPRGEELMDRFHGLIASTSDKLGAAHDAVALDLARDHEAVLRTYERSLWLSGIAGAVSLLAIVLGVALIGRITTRSIDRLVDGASRFAHGDREHRIDVAVPPELRQVAAEFNRMIGRIRESEEALADLARRDPLTQLLNRRAFDEALVEAFARKRRLGERVALLAMDVDRFKRINDTYGHGVGDEVLRAVARTMATNVRVFDHVFRIGGEEFAALLLGCDEDGARRTAERLRRSIAAQSVRTKDGTISATVSIGIALVSAASGPIALREAADAALYRAKADGRDRVVFSSDVLTEAEAQTHRGNTDPKPPFDESQDYAKLLNSSGLGLFRRPCRS